MVRVLMFCRLSREGGRSVERQEQDGRRLAAERGWEVAEVFKEWASASEFSKKGLSGRKEWRRLLSTIEGLRDEIRAGQQYAVILWMEDRSARHIVQAWEFVKLCKDVGLRRIVLPSYEYDLSDPEDEAKFMGEVLHAQREMAKMSKRIRRAQLEAAENGEPHPGGPRRFGTVGIGKSKVSLAQAERECQLIHEAADRVLAGDSLRGIVLDWHERGITTSTGRPFQNTTLKQMLVATARRLSRSPREATRRTLGRHSPSREMGGSTGGAHRSRPRAAPARCNSSLLAEWNRVLWEVRASYVWAHRLPKGDDLLLYVPEPARER